MGYFVFAGCCVIAWVVGYWLRKGVRVLAVIGALLEASLNRASKNRGETPISDEIDSRTFLGD